MKRIVLTGGGTTGHVAVNLALIPKLLDEGWDVHYIGSEKGIEKDLIEKVENVTYHSISTGKLRRFKSAENFKDIFRVIKGTFQSINKIRKIKPNIVFSKGGFVSVPVIVGGWINRVPSITHESDLTPGLANKLSQPFVKEIMVTFPETLNYIKKKKGFYLGPVVRDSLKNGDSTKGKEFLEITNDKKNLLVMGGSLGARALNELIRGNLDTLLKDYNIIHGVGKGNKADIDVEGYYQLEYIGDELKDIMQMSDVVISRAGSNAIFEFLYFKIPMLLIPLPTNQSRGDQIDNAKTFAKNGYAEVIMEENLTKDLLLQTIDKLSKESSKYKENMSKFVFKDGKAIIYEEILRLKKNGK